jgi:hypothetical protein
MIVQHIRGKKGSSVSRTCHPAPPFSLMTPGTRTNTLIPGAVLQPKKNLVWDKGVPRALMVSLGNSAH